MAADPIIYCLEKLTDYDQFERLAHDLMALEGYPAIEPLGGDKDKGRDALHVSRQDGQTTIFAYSVRKDWSVKLREDAQKVKDHGHACQRLVFVCTAAFSATERDEAVDAVRKEFGWPLELYGQERLRVLLTAHPRYVPRHPQIFTPSIVAGVPTADRSQEADHLFLDYAAADEVLALWLARRLIAEGYRVWCRGLSLRGGETGPQVMEEVLRQRSFRALSILSRAALADADVRDRRSIAHAVAAERSAEFLIPLAAEDVSPDTLEWRSRSLAVIRFDRS